MLQTIYSRSRNKEYNHFTSFTFSAQEWSAPSLVDPIEIQVHFASFNLEGRTITDMRFVGLCYHHRREMIEEHAYCFLDHLDEEERKKHSEYENIDPDMPFYRAVTIDEPFLIEFKDGDTFEIETEQEPEYRFSMNCIPWDINAGTNSPNLDANIVFSTCLGKTIVAVEVNRIITDKHPFTNHFFDEAHSKREIVSNIVLRLDNGTGIKIESECFDYCYISIIDEQQQTVTMPFKDLKPGLFNWEDIHIDQVTNFESEGATFFFGEIGREQVEPPYIRLEPDKIGSKLYIDYTDFLIFEWIIIWFTKDAFDEYGYYNFSASQWNTMLEEAEKILRFERFDDVYEYLTGLDKQSFSGLGIFLSSLNVYGTDFWKKKERYKTQLKDMKNWSSTVLSESVSLHIYGF